MIHTIQADNVRDALHSGIKYLAEVGEKVGNVVTAPNPVVTVYRRPWERVLVWPLRDANPFFHLFEAIWMLAGRRDVAFLNLFIKDFGDRFGEANGYEHDAYGYRWRTAFGFDQLAECIDKLKSNALDRHTVIQMWDCTGNSNDLRGDWKTRPCNTHAYLRVRNHRLDITVCNRSNDIIWGAYGANAVQFSILQEYLAAQLDLSIGVYYQVSNNYHAYADTFYKLVDQTENLCYYPSVKAIIEYPRLWDQELNLWMRSFDEHEYRSDLKNGFLSHTLTPMAHAHACWRDKDAQAALKVAMTIKANDWREACVQWLTRRIK